jgi:ribosomal protein S18 acetylase RimI-like enzyme
VRAQTKAHSYRFRGGVLRVAAWHGRSDVASIALSGTDAPTLDVLDRILDRLRAEGFVEAVTNAVGPAASLPLVDAGFTVRERLHLLEHDLTNLPPPSGETRRALRADRPVLVSIDSDAFDDFWRFDDLALREAERATPRTRTLVAPRAGDPQGFGLFGRGDATGYVQRLAIAPAAQGAGLGRAVLGDGLRWLAGQGATRALVNTQENNARALDLYARAGFSRLPVGLCVLGRRL